MFLKEATRQIDLEIERLTTIRNTLATGEAPVASEAPFVDEEGGSLRYLGILGKWESFTSNDNSTEYAFVPDEQPLVKQFLGTHMTLFLSRDVL